MKRDEIIVCCKKTAYDELYNLYTSPNIIRMIKSRRMRWAGHIARMAEKRNSYRILVAKRGLAWFHSRSTSCGEKAI
jgi:hypothetical protein